VALFVEDTTASWQRGNSPNSPLRGLQVNYQTGVDKQGKLESAMANLKTKNRSFFQHSSVLLSLNKMKDFSAIIQSLAALGNHNYQPFFILLHQNYSVLVEFH